MLSNIIKVKRRNVLSSIYACRKLSSYEDCFDPPYLESLKPKIPIYGLLNIQMKGYDFVILENYQKLVHRIARIMGIDVVDGWATPAVVHKIKRFKPNSSVIDAEYVLKTYERNIQVADLSSTVAPLFFELIQAALPQSASLRVHEHLEEHEIVRHVPDQELKELKTQLSDLSIKKK